MPPGLLWIALLCGAAVGAMPSAASARPAATAAHADPTIVLVHGAFLDASSWGEVGNALVLRGRRVIAVDLRSGEPRAASERTLADYRQAVLASIASESSPVALVGHSFGGMTIAAVAEAAPDRVERLVFIGAYIPSNGDSLQRLAAADRDSRTAEGFVVDPRLGIASIDRGARTALFCSDCPPSVGQAAAASMLAEPLPPLLEPVVLSAPYAGVEKRQIRTTLDPVISPRQQRWMADRANVGRRVLLRAGHSPFLSRPEATAALIDHLTRQEP